jgi:hypothetical protein
MWCDSTVLEGVTAALATIRRGRDVTLTVQICRGRVDLGGLVGTWAERWSAVAAVQHVSGVEWVADSIVVTSPDLATRLDAHILGNDDHVYRGLTPDLGAYRWRRRAGAQLVARP